jgi:hypothetical protein
MCFRAELTNDTNGSVIDYSPISISRDINSIVRRGVLVLITPDKAALVMELVGEMKSPEKVPVRRQLLGGGSKVTIHSLNNKTKRYIHIPQCTAGDSAHTALRNNKVVEQIVETIDGGVKSPEGLDVGTLWLGKRFAEVNRDEFIACSLRAGY